MELSGEVLGIIYQNELNSYTIAEMYADELEKIETIVGYLPFITEGDNVKVVGKFVEHKDYGEQFKVDYFEKNFAREDCNGKCNALELIIKHFDRLVKIDEAKESLLKFYNNVSKKPKFMCIIVGNFSAIVKDKDTGIYIIPITALKP